MIVLDEQIHSSIIVRAIAHWYSGSVVSIKQLRPKTLIKDDAISILLRAASQPTFVTINVTDFWRRIPPDPRYGIFCIELPLIESPEIPFTLREALRFPEFHTKAARMGKIVCIRRSYIDYYESDLHLHRIPRSK